MAWDDTRIETYVAQMLRGGVSLAAIVVFAGGVLYLVHAHGPHPDYTSFQGTPQPLRDLRGILTLAWSLDARGLIQLGLLILIATPIARVVMCIVGFLCERDRLYTTISTIVFAILLYSLLHGR
jgi:uncharacterized membrane protein